ncbi:MAG: protein kinase [Bradymonadaceae bacterium]|nr:protein kinase [Lujinxingiaceae bacterium]
MSDKPDVQAEIERRLEQISRDPEALRRYDINADGIIDGVEWDEVRRVVTAEVHTAWQREHTQPMAALTLQAIGQSDRPVLETLNGRFDIYAEIGRGAQGITSLGRDRTSGRQVAVKELLLDRVSSWKGVELFEREGRALANLDHPCIPAYVDTFHIADASGQERFFLVQEFVEGDNYEKLLAGGLSMTEADARDFAVQTLHVLDYLHERSPPVVHRDIKPSNMIRRPDGSIALIDFGAVQAIVPDAYGGSTIVGTSGYMPVEQLMGRAVAATDLYALGATLAHLLSHRHPADLPVEFMRLSFRPFVNVSEHFASFLDRMLEPHVEKRFRTAKEALRYLEGPPVQLVSQVNQDERITAALIQARAITKARLEGQGPAQQPAAKTSPVAKISTAAVLVMITVVVLFFPIVSNKIFGHDEQVLNVLRACPLAEEMLGTDIGKAVGCAWGESKTNGSSGISRWSMPVSGTKARGRYDFSMSKSRGKWTVDFASLKAGDTQINAITCEYVAFDEYD